MQIGNDLVVPEVRGDVPGTIHHMHWVPVGPTIV